MARRNGASRIPAPQQMPPREPARSVHWAYCLPRSSPCCVRAASHLAHCAAGVGNAAVVHTSDAVVAVGSSIVDSKCRRWRRYSCGTAGVVPPAATTTAGAHAAREGRAASRAQAFATLAAAAFTLGRPAAAAAAAAATLAVSSTAASAFAVSTASATASRTRKRRGATPERALPPRRAQQRTCCGRRADALRRGHGRAAHACLGAVRRGRVLSLAFAGGKPRQYPHAPPVELDVRGLCCRAGSGRHALRLPRRRRLVQQALLPGGFGC